jgi:Xaa-Pro dipeptidase
LTTPTNPRIATHDVETLVAERTPAYGTPPLEAKVRDDSVPQDDTSSPIEPKLDVSSEASSVDLLRRATVYGLERTQAALRESGLAAALLFDAYNIRYVTGTAVMPVWSLHAMDRYVLVPAEGKPILWESPLVPVDPATRSAIEVRKSGSWSVFDVGARSQVRAASFATELVELLKELGIHGEPIGLDRIDTYGFLALQEAGLKVRPAQFAMETARSIKSLDEIELLRRSVAVADAAIAHLRATLKPGMTENEVWSSFTSHAFAQGGEYVECRLLSSGPRTNPWFQEATSRVIEPGDLVSFDTDLIGPAGYLADISRGYLAGDVTPTDLQRRLYYDAETFLEEIRTALRPGAAFDELGERLSRRFPRQYHAQRYPFIAHSSGLSDEYPTIVFENHHQGEVTSGMVFSIEAYVGAEDEVEGLKLEEQVVITPDGAVVLSHAPHEDRLSNR